MLNIDMIKKLPSRDFAEFIHKIFTDCGGYACKTCVLFELCGRELNRIEIEEWLMEEYKPEPMKFKKKPVEIEAIQYTGQNSLEIIEWMSANNSDRPCVSNDDCLVITTLEGDMKANIGDWIIKGVQGEFYPCKPDIFDETYIRIGV